MAKQESRLKQKYQDQIHAELQSELQIKNPMAVPTLTKIVVNAGVGRQVNTDNAYLDEIIEDIKAITGQRPVVTLSKKAISNFKLRENTSNGVMVTLRQDKMWDFFDKLVNVTLPRVKDFRGVSAKSFDKRGNYALGIKEHLVFPEVDTSKMIKIKPLQVIICTSAETDDQARLLLKKLGMPFKKN